MADCTAIVSALLFFAASISVLLAGAFSVLPGHFEVLIRPHFRKSLPMQGLVVKYPCESVSVPWIFSLTLSLCLCLLDEVR